MAITSAIICIYMCVLCINGAHSNLAAQHIIQYDHLRGKAPITHGWRSRNVSHILTELA